MWVHLTTVFWKVYPLVGRMAFGLVDWSEKKKAGNLADEMAFYWAVSKAFLMVIEMAEAMAVSKVAVMAEMKVDKLETLAVVVWVYD